jgi:hypothetical protein
MVFNVAKAAPSWHANNGAPSADRHHKHHAARAAPFSHKHAPAHKTMHVPLLEKLAIKEQVKMAAVAAHDSAPLTGDLPFGAMMAVLALCGLTASATMVAPPMADVNGMDPETYLYEGWSVYQFM